MYLFLSTFLSAAKCYLNFLSKVIQRKLRLDWVTANLASHGFLPHHAYTSGILNISGISKHCRRKKKNQSFSGGKKEIGDRKRKKELFFLVLFPNLPAKNS